ncbi:hypothetical protein ACFE04_028009 [Oxalis oulophora]
MFIDFKDDPEIYVFSKLKYVAIELWQVCVYHHQSLSLDVSKALVPSKLMTSFMLLQKGFMMRTATNEKPGYESEEEPVTIQNEKAVDPPIKLKIPLCLPPAEPTKVERVDKEFVLNQHAYKKAGYFHFLMAPASVLLLSVKPLVTATSTRLVSLGLDLVLLIMVSNLLSSTVDSGLELIFQQGAVVDVNWKSLMKQPLILCSETMEKGKLKTATLSDLRL